MGFDPWPTERLPAPLVEKLGEEVLSAVEYCCERRHPLWDSPPSEAATGLFFFAGWGLATFRNLYLGWVLEFCGFTVASSQFGCLGLCEPIEMDGMTPVKPA